MKVYSFLNGSHIPALTAYEYRDYLISAWARPEFSNGFTSVGIVYKRGRLESIIQVQRIEGELFETKEQAEQHGVELCNRIASPILSPVGSHSARYPLIEPGPTPHWLVPV